jgi:hypothetical protein
MNVYFFAAFRLFAPLREIPLPSGVTPETRCALIPAYETFIS